MNGVWLAHFNAGAAHGSGIAVLREGEILGGDFSHSWVGTFEEEGPQVYARVRVAPHGVNGAAEAAEKPFVLTLAGAHTENEATLTGHADGNDVSVSIDMHRAV